MQRKFLMLGLLLFLLSGTTLMAQTSTTNNDFLANLDTDISTETTNENWSFFMDDENHICYIDFETISVNLSDVQIKDANGEVLLKEDVWELPVNTIYEVDMSTYKPGEYNIELRSFTGTFKKKITIK